MTTSALQDSLTANQLPRWAAGVALAGSLIVAGFVIAPLSGGFNPVGTAVAAVVIFLLVMHVWAIAVEGVRKAKDRLATHLVIGAFVLALIPLVSLVWEVLSKGFGRLDPTFFSYSMRNVVAEGGGAIHAIYGTLYVTDGLAAFEQGGADIILLDLMLPGMSGTEVCRRIRARSNVPIIMVTARDTEIDKVVGLELGADDFVTKPFSHRELTARIRAVLRRGADDPKTESQVLQASGVRLDPERHEVLLNGKPVQLPLKEFELLELLMENAGRVVSRSRIIDQVWGLDYVGDTKTLDVHIKRLRAKLEDDPANPLILHTVRGVGYKFGE